MEVKAYNVYYETVTDSGNMMIEALTPEDAKGIACDIIDGIQYVDIVE